MSQVANIKLPFTHAEIVVDQNRVCKIDFSARSKSKNNSSPEVKTIIQQLKAYCQSDGKKFSFDCELNLEGTVFQKKVWKELQRIPYGEVRTYGDIAKKLKSSPRAVGNACRKNPVPIIVPCHRVVSAKGLGGYGGQTQGKNMKIKQWLLHHEGYLS